MRSLLVLVLVLPSLACAQDPAKTEPKVKSKAKVEKKKADARVRGVTVSCQTWGWEWGSDAMLDCLDWAKKNGANWVAIHPYARIRNDGTVRSYRMGEETPKCSGRGKFQFE